MARLILPQQGHHCLRLRALRRDLFYAHQSGVRRRYLDDQTDQVLCLTLVTNTCVLWTSTYLGDALDSLRCEAQVGFAAAATCRSAQAKNEARQATHPVYAFVSGAAEGTSFGGRPLNGRQA